MKLIELKTELKNRNLSSTGNKIDLIKRLETNDKGIIVKKKTKIDPKLESKIDKLIKLESKIEKLKKLESMTIKDDSMLELTFRGMMGQYYNINIGKHNTFHQLREKVAEVVYAPISKIILYRIMCGENTTVEMGDIMYQNGSIGKKMTDDIDEEPLDKLNIKDSDIFNVTIRLL